MITLDLFELVLLLGWIILSLAVVFWQDRKIRDLDQQLQHFSLDLYNRYRSAYPEMERWERYWRNTVHKEWLQDWKRKLHNH
jgi:hypothetical protein